MLEGSIKFSLWKIVRNIYCVWCCGPPKVWHFLKDKSRWLAINSLVSPFLIKWDAIASAETGQWRGECRDLPVRLFKILHAFRLECEKSMLRTASDHESLRFPSIFVSKAVAVKLESSLWRDCRKFYRGIHTLHPNTECSYFDNRVG